MKTIKVNNPIYHCRFVDNKFVVHKGIITCVNETIITAKFPESSFNPPKQQNYPDYQFEQFRVGDDMFLSIKDFQLYIYKYVKQVKIALALRKKEINNLLIQSKSFKLVE